MLADTPPYGMPTGANLPTAAGALRSSLQARIAQSLREHIRQQGLQVGDRLNLDSFARTLGVSRTPVQAAFDHLAQAGVLEQRPNRGYFIARAEAPVPAAEARFGDLHGRILNDMTHGDLSGSTSESALLRRYGVGRGELGTVLRRLAREGLAQPSLGRGWSFVALSLESMVQSYRLRMHLEPSFVMDPGFLADPSRLLPLLRDHDAMLEALAGPHAEEVLFDATFALDARFHQTLADLSGNRFHAELIRSHNVLRRTSEFLGRVRVANVRRSFQEHHAILEALLDGERDWAAAQLRRHLLRAADNVTRYFQGDIDAIRGGPAAAPEAPRDTTTKGD
ncbi:GntR family transcriptional regulator [Zavarzinia sp. CC-PAN008]|uniref:GntR family transcriptional regulator n=1 Tax=Zavarzinia sp. CC-PAN008 TaxID=3243332 RepID=UPI003F747E1D